MIRPIDSAEIKSEPTWAVARLFPDQGAWSEEDLMLSDSRPPNGRHRCAD